MVAFNAIATLSIVIASAMAHPVSEQLVARQYVDSVQTASRSYQQMSSEFSSLRQSIAGGQVSFQSAQQQFQSLSSQASSTVLALNNCQRCFDHGSAATLTTSASQAYSEMNSLVQTANEVYGPQAQQLVSPISQLDGPLQTNLDRFSGAGVGAQSLLPPNFAQTMGQSGFPRLSDFASQYQNGPGGGSGF
ncbi:hypothetical protein PTTG_01186 [Puccinia triticina 1-1 BBBD Race 1]|uniref:Uncharacterized protein n=1 Tax=Puccinia triticina (isolate 1-1 / race 1 (BBBD)) TaxID=630390 RepID=A0A180GZY9_PUCT1|nr:hypothetical protein PTTG_01186 [Puccinia triticina 1-1 BBBD Race 1]